MHFPPDFLWGVGTSAYQIEGAAQSDGKEESIWDRFCLKSGAIQNQNTGDIATDHYHRWKEDVEILKQLKVKSYRFSISWPRFFPGGKINPQGLAFYNQLIDELFKANIEPMVTLYHWDLPQSLQDKGGWPNRDIVDSYLAYVRAAFEAFGDRVNYWITHNEPWVIAVLGYELGVHAPGIKDSNAALKAAHHLLLSHGLAVREMRSLAKRPIKIGIALNLSPVHPIRDPQASHYDLYLNRLYLDVLFKGVYPSEIDMQASAEDMRIISEPIDFLGVNYYTRVLIQPNGKPLLDCPNPYSSMWEFYPQGLGEIIERIVNDYFSNEIYITENGTAIDGIDDPMRIAYIDAHLKKIEELIKKGISIKGYFAWSFLDNFEWAHGYGKRFGLVHVDYTTLKRTIKSSGHWYAKFASSQIAFA